MTVFMTMCDNFTWQDDEIQNQARLINQLKEQLGEQEDALKATQVDSEKLQSQISSMQSESETSKTEVKEVLQALEELAVNYDQKLQEVETKTKENEKLSDEVSQKQVRRSSDFLYFTVLYIPYCNVQKKVATSRLFSCEMLSLLLRITEHLCVGYITRQTRRVNDFCSAIRCQIDGTKGINNMYRSRLIWVVEGLESEEIGKRKKRFLIE